jgi:hypothetical protein
VAAQITINLSDSDEALLNKITAEHNGAIPNQPNPLTPAQMLRQTVRDWLRTFAERYSERDRLGMRKAYNLATAEERAQIDAILAPYADDVAALRR